MRWRGQGCDHGHTGHELLHEVVLGQLEHLRAENGSIVVHGLDNETIREWPDAEFARTVASLGGHHLVTLLDGFHACDDFKLFRC